MYGELTPAVMAFAEKRTLPDSRPTGARIRFSLAGMLYGYLQNMSYAVRLRTAVKEHVRCDGAFDASTIRLTSAYARHVWDVDSFRRGAAAPLLRFSLSSPQCLIIRVEIDLLACGGSKGNGLMELDAKSADPALKNPTTSGQFDTWVTPMNYFGLLTMLESIGYYSASEKKCLRPFGARAAQLAARMLAEPLLHGSVCGIQLCAARSYLSLCSTCN